MNVIVSNKVKCLLCDNIIESKYRHDFVTCKCGNVSIDGGLDYLKRLYKSLKTYKELSEYKKKER